jgi:flagellar L-ring protein precursor FlgH
MSRALRAAAALAIMACSLAAAARADNLYRNGGWAAMSSDRRAAAVGDTVTIVIFEAAEAVNSAQSTTRRNTDLGGSIRAGSIGEQAELGFGGGFSGRGEVRRSDRVVAQITVTVQEVLANGDLVIAGEQWLLVNVVLSSRIADAQIDYDGRGFVSQSARPGLIARIFRFLGLS